MSADQEAPRGDWVSEALTRDPDPSPATGVPTDPTVAGDPVPPLESSGAGYDAPPPLLPPDVRADADLGEGPGTTAVAPVVVDEGLIDGEGLIDTDTTEEDVVDLRDTTPASSAQADWADLQSRFVDDPSGAVAAAAGQVQAAIDRLKGSLAAPGQDAGTEDLRIAFKRFREVDEALGRL